MAKDILVGYRVNIDAVDGWLGSYGDEDSPDDISGGGVCRRNWSTKAFKPI